MPAVPLEDVEEGEVINDGHVNVARINDRGILKTVHGNSNTGKNAKKSKVRMEVVNDDDEDKDE